jgi:hypothetical protein
MKADAVSDLSSLATQYQSMIKYEMISYHLSVTNGCFSSELKADSSATDEEDVAQLINRLEIQQRSSQVINPNVSLGMFYYLLV